MFELSDNVINAQQLKEKLKDSSAGCSVIFEGLVRDNNDGQAVSGIIYEAYPELAITEGEKVLAEALEKFDITTCLCVHQVGTLSVGDIAVWIGVSAPHRIDGFEACRYIIDEIKQRVPIWKKEIYTDGSSHWLEGESKPE